MMARIDIETGTKIPNMQDKTVAAIKMVNTGVDPKTALQLVNMRDNISPAAVTKLRQKVKKYSLLQPKIQKLAHKAITDCLTDTTIKQIKKKIDANGNDVEIIEEIPPTWSNKIAAASMIYDRAEPVQRASDVQVNAITVQIPAAAQEIIDRMSAWRQPVKVEDAPNTRAPEITQEAQYAGR